MGSETAFVNGEKIKPNILVQIEPEDKISLGSMSFSLCLNVQMVSMKRFVDLRKISLPKIKTLDFLQSSLSNKSHNFFRV